MRLVTTVHGWGVKGSLRTEAYYALDRWLLRHYDEVLCVSEDLERRSLDAGVARQRCWHVPNAIDTDEYRRRRPAAVVKRELGVPAQRLVIGAVGRLSPEKAFDLLIEVVADLHAGRGPTAGASGLDLELWIVGEGGERGRLERRIEELGMSDRVRLLGYRDDTVPLYEAMDVYALSSTREGLPNALLEAMALGLPVVATRIAGVPGLVEDGRYGLLVEPGSAAELSRALETLARDRTLRERLGTEARGTIERSHSFAQRMETVRHIYDRTLASHAPTPHAPMPEATR
jgi:glycosyltransferase involved in cell wall biosynthesis